MLFFYTPILVDLPPRHIRKIAQRFGSLKTSPVSEATLSTYLHLDALIFIFYKSAVVKSRLLQGATQLIVAKTIWDKLFVEFSNVGMNIHIYF